MKRRLEEGGSCPTVWWQLCVAPEAPGVIQLQLLETRVWANGALGQGPGRHRSPTQPTASLPPLQSSCCGGWREDQLEWEKAVTSSSSLPGAGPYPEGGDCIGRAGPCGS